MIRERSLFFFSASNPGIETGGVFGESKISILDKVPVDLKPKTIFAKSDDSSEAVRTMMERSGISFPLIIKPDVGEKGFLVEKISDFQTLVNYRKRFKIDFIIQEFVSLPYECNLLYYKIPGEHSGNVLSITNKEFLNITGNGKATVLDLMKEKPRAVLQMNRMKKEKPDLMKFIPKSGEIVKIEPIGNHARGTAFLDGRNLINDEVVEAFDKIANRIPGMFVYRFDLKCKSPDDLKTGDNIKLVEVNGAGGEPTHIYQPGYSLVRAWKDLFQLWRIIHKISRINHSQGVPYMSFNEGITRIRNYRNYKAHIQL